MYALWNRYRYGSAPPQGNSGSAQHSQRERVHNLVDCIIDNGPEPLMTGFMEVSACGLLLAFLHISVLSFCSRRRIAGDETIRHHIALGYGWGAIAAS